MYEGTRTVAQPVKLLPVKPASYRVPVCVLAAPLLAKGLEKAVEHDSSVWVPATHMENTDEAVGSWFQSLAIVESLWE